MVTRKAEVGETGCPACGTSPCECPDPLGQCRGCRVLLYEDDAWVTDTEGEHWCAQCQTEAWR